MCNIYTQKTQNIAERNGKPKLRDHVHELEDLILL